MKKFFNLDLHISVIADIKDIFKRISDIEIVDWSVSGHSWVFEKGPADVKVVNQHTWQSINMDMVSRFQEEYNSFLSEFDGFIVAHPNVFALLYEKYNKPVIVVNSCRYDMPFCFNGNMSMVGELNACFARLQSKGLLHFVSNNKADNKYFKLANPNISTSVTPSLCMYTNMKWDSSETNNKFLLYSGSLPDNFHPLVTLKKDIGKFSWDSIMKFRGIIHIPYEASTMSMFEHISSGIPLFFPSRRFLKELWVTHKTHFQCNYWKDLGGRSTPDYLRETNNHDFWIERGDMYDLRGVYFFDSFDELKQKMETFTDSQYDIRIQYIEKRKKKVLESWKTLLHNIEHPPIKKRTITANLAGGLGNQMFQIANAFSASKKFSLDLVFVRNQFNGCRQGSPPMKYYDTLYKKLTFVEELKEDCSVNEKSWTAYPVMNDVKEVLKKHENTLSLNIVFNGYFQSDQSFKEYANEVRHLFTPVGGIIEYLEKNTTFFERFPELKEPHNFTYVGVRRGDYVQYADFHNPCGMTYYNRAMNEMPNERFYIASDDYAWCKENFKGDNIRFFDIEDELEQLFACALFKNYIISNSPYHWWGSYLSIYDSPNIVAPNKWIFGKDVQPNQYETIYREGMKVIDRPVEA